MSGSAAPSARRPWLVLAVVAIGYLMVVLDLTIVNVALPRIQGALGFAGESDLQWVTNAYALTFGGFLLLGGRVADRYGRRRIFLVGVALFGTASLAAGFSGSASGLITARVAQGLGGALMSPAALSLLTIAFPEGEARNRALGIWAAVAGAGGALGLVLGGILTDGLSWRWVFFINAPISVLLVVAAPRVIDESRDSQAGGFDAVGAVTATGGLVALVYALVRANDVGWATVQTVGLLVAAAALLVAFVAQQARGRNPLMPLRMFRNGYVAGADLGMLFISAATFGILFFITLYLQEIHGYSPIRTGIAFLPVSLVAGVFAQLSSPLLTKIGARTIAVTGLTVAGVGLLLFCRISPSGTYVSNVLLPLAVFGAGMGAAFVSLTAAGVAGVPAEDSGVASALVNSAQQVGGALGLAILTAVANARFNAIGPLAAEAGAVASATTSGWTWGFGVAAVLLFLGAGLCGYLMRTSNAVDATPARIPLDA